MTKTMPLVPRMSEKVYGLSKDRQTYVFDVPSVANKITVAAAVADQFNVTVENVNITIAKGKVKQTYATRRGGKRYSGRDNDVKKAYVRIKDGDHIPVFAAVEEDEAKAEKTAERMEKITARQAKKDAKSAAKAEKKTDKEAK